MKRIKTGIPGLDNLIESGFPHPSSIMLTGPPGVGKTIFGLQFLYKGVTDYNEPGFMITIEDYPLSLAWYQERFNWDFKSLESKGLLFFTKYDPIDFEKFELRTLHPEIILQLSKIIDHIGAKRLVIDSITPIGLAVGDRARFRTILYYLSKALKEKDCTTVFVSEKTSPTLTEFNVEPFIMDGVIELSFTPKEDTVIQTLAVRKMVATSISQVKFVFDISDEGMRLVPSIF